MTDTERIDFIEHSKADVWAEGWQIWCVGETGNEHHPNDIWGRNADLRKALDQAKEEYEKDE